MFPLLVLLRVGQILDLKEFFQAIAGQLGLSLSCCHEAMTCC